MTTPPTTPPTNRPFRFGVVTTHAPTGTAPDNAALGQALDPAAVRVSRLTQSLDIVHRLLDGQTVTTHGPHYTTTDATIDAPGTDLPHVPLLVAAAAPRMLALAARHADTVALGVPLHTDAPDITRRTTLLDTHRPRNTPRPELNLNLMAVGDAVPRYLADRIDPTALAAAGAVSVLTGTPHAMADQLLERRERLGISYYVVAQELVEAFTPVLRLLSGR